MVVKGSKRLIKYCYSGATLCRKELMYNLLIISSITVYFQYRIIITLILYITYQDYIYEGFCVY